MKALDANFFLYAISELKSQGFDVPEYKENPQNEEEKKYYIILVKNIRILIVKKNAITVGILKKREMFKMN